MRAATGAEVEGLVKFLKNCGLPVTEPVEPVVDGDNVVAYVGGLRFTVPLEDVARGAPLPGPEAEPSAVENGPVEE